MNNCHLHTEAKNVCVNYVSKKYAEEYINLINLWRILSLYSSVLYAITRWFSSLTAVLLNIVFVWLDVIWLIFPDFHSLGQKLCQHTTKLYEAANILGTEVCKEQMPPCKPWHPGTPHILKNYVCAQWKYCICQEHLSRKWKYITGSRTCLKDWFTPHKNPFVHWHILHRGSCWG